MDAIPPYIFDVPAEVRRIEHDCTYERPRLRNFVVVQAGQEAGHHEAPGHHEEHALGTRIVATTSTSTDGPRTTLIAAVDHLEHAVDAVSHSIAVDLQGWYYLGGHPTKAYRIY
jgi:hypothetical protein